MGRSLSDVASPTPIRNTSSRADLSLPDRWSGTEPPWESSGGGPVVVRRRYYRRLFGFPGCEGQGRLVFDSRTDTLYERCQEAQ